MDNVFISDIKARSILDSRDEWTIETEVILGDGSSGIGSVPSGKSRGKREAFVILPHDAVHNIMGPIKKSLKGFKVTTQEKFDERLISLDGTINKRHLGGNTLLSLSIAFAKAVAHSKRVPLWRHIGDLSNNQNFTPVKLFVNLINGGVHAENNLPFQEYIMIPEAVAYSKSVEFARSVYQNLKEVILEKKGQSGLCMGDEGGFAPRCEDFLEPFALISEAIRRTKNVIVTNFGLDSANGAGKLNKDEMGVSYKKMVADYKLHYLEDPYGENDVSDFIFTKSYFKELIVTGDDLTVSNSNIIRDMVQKKAINGVIIKPNQIGTLSEALLAVKVAKEKDVKVVVSHRSGETNDDFIADFAHGVGAYGFKLGSPARGERVSKYNRLLAIEEGF